MEGLFCFFGERERWSDGSSDHGLNLRSVVVLAHLDRGIIGSMPKSWDRGWSGSDGAMDHCIIVDIVWPEGAIEQWIIGSTPDSWDRGSTLYVGAKDHWIIGAKLP